MSIFRYSEAFQVAPAGSPGVESSTTTADSYSDFEAVLPPWPPGRDEALFEASVLVSAQGAVSVDPDVVLVYDLNGFNTIVKEGSGWVAYMPKLESIATLNSSLDASSVVLSPLPGQMVGNTTLFEPSGEVDVPAFWQGFVLTAEDGFGSTPGFGGWTPDEAPPITVEFELVAADDGYGAIGYIQDVMGSLAPMTVNLWGTECNVSSLFWWNEELYLNLDDPNWPLYVWSHADITSIFGTVTVFPEAPGFANQGWEDGSTYTVQVAFYPASNRVYPPQTP